MKVFWVDVSESSGAGSAGLLRSKGRTTVVVYIVKTFRIWRHKSEIFSAASVDGRTRSVTSDDASVLSAVRGVYSDTTQLN